MSDIQATFTSTDRAFHVEGYEKIDFSLLYVTGAFKPENPEIADSYRQFSRCLMVVDKTVYGLYGEQIQAYFIHHAIELSVFQVSTSTAGFPLHSGTPLGGGRNASERGIAPPTNLTSCALSKGGGV